MSALRVQNLTVSIEGITRVDDVSLEVSAGEILAVVGESGAGKSLLLSALLGLQPDISSVSAAALEINGESMLHASSRQWRGVRGVDIGLISQDALSSLDPLRTIEAEVREVLDVHRIGDRRSRAIDAIAALEKAAVPEPVMRARQHPHELSGGLRQRALIASAIAAEPSILIADEPTTALDASVQRRILDLLRSLADDGRAMIFVSHDLAAVSHIADRIAVMKDGRIVEQGDARTLLSYPQHPYTVQLIGASRLAPRELAISNAPVVLEADDITVRFGDLVAVSNVSLSVRRGSTLGVVGESGSGKSTLAMALMGAQSLDSGEVRLDGELFNPQSERIRRPRRHRIQLVAQNPRASLNPRWSIARTLREARAIAGLRADDAAIASILATVGLSADIGQRRPRSLSGGQAQRVAIARALAVEPEVLVLDEPLSALDVSLQAELIRLLTNIQRDRELAMVFISHDLRVIAALAQDVVVMRLGEIVEAGQTATVLSDPQHEFTRELIAASMLDAR